MAPDRPPLTPEQTLHLLDDIEQIPTRPVGPHLDEEDLVGLVSSSLSASRRATVLEHIRSCAQCAEDAVNVPHVLEEATKDRRQAAQSRAALNRPSSDRPAAAASDPRVADLVWMVAATAVWVATQHVRARVAMRTRGTATAADGPPLVPEALISISKQRLVITREIGDRAGEMRALGDLGATYQDVAETQQAIGYYEQALAIAREIADRSVEAISTFNLAILFGQQQDTQRSRAYAAVASRVFREIGREEDAQRAVQLIAPQCAIDVSGGRGILRIRTQHPEWTRKPIRCVISDEATGNIWAEALAILSGQSRHEDWYIGEAQVPHDAPQTWKVDVVVYESFDQLPSARVKLLQRAFSQASGDVERSAWRTWFQDELDAGRMTADDVLVITAE